MKRCAVIGASSGTGLEIVRQLAARQVEVTAISRHPPEPSPFVTPRAADVTDAASLAAALDGPYEAVFFTVDIHGAFKGRKAVRAVVHDGCINAIRATAASGGTPRFVLLSVIGTDRASWVWGLLDFVKSGLRRNLIEREAALAGSGLRYVVCRAPKLNDGPGGEIKLAASPPRHKLDMKMGISRRDLAGAMIRAAQAAPADSLWDIFADTAGPRPDWLDGGDAAA